MSDLVPVTRTGYEKLKAELDQMENVEMPKVAQRIAAARSEGDLSENAEYHGARESQGMLQAKINLLRDKLLAGHDCRRQHFAKDEVSFGATVVVKDLDFGDEEVFVLVGAGEEDYDAGQDQRHQPAGPGAPGTQSRGESGNPGAGRQDAIRDPRDSLGMSRLQAHDERDHGSSPSNKAEPIRTSVAPSSIADFEIVAHAHRKLVERNIRGGRLRN